MTVDLLAYLARWVDDLNRPSLTAAFAVGPEDRPKRAAWATVEGPAAAGQVTVWESGEVELEAFNLATSEAILVETAMAHTEGELDALLSRLLAACGRP